jgi:hypothetical protein
MQFVTPSNGWAITGSALARTLDGGATWHALDP